MSGGGPFPRIRLRVWFLFQGWKNFLINLLSDSTNPNFFSASEKLGIRRQRRVLSLRLLAPFRRLKAKRNKQAFLFTELPLKKRSSRSVSILAPAGASSPSFLPSLLSLRQQRRGRRRRPRREGQPRERPQGPSQGRRKRRRDRDPRPRGSRRETRTRARRRRGACGRGRRRHRRRTQEPLVEAGPVDHEPAAVAVDVPRVLLLEVVPSEEKRERRGSERERERDKAR